MTTPAEAARLKTRAEDLRIEAGHASFDGDHGRARQLRSLAAGLDRQAIAKAPAQPLHRSRITGQLRTAAR